MQDVLTSLFTSLLCLLPLLVMGLFFLGGVALFIWFIARAQRPKDPAALAADREKLRATVEKLMPQVRPWQPEVLAHPCTDENTFWTRFGNNITVRGLVAAALPNKGSNWAAFALDGRRVYSGPFSFHGQALARTTEHTFEFNARPAGVAIRLNGSPFGTLQPGGNLLDANGQSIGHFQREGEKGRPTFPVTLHGRVVAHLAKPVYHSKGIIIFKRDKQPPPPAVEIVASDMTPNEANWLPALVLWQIVDRAAIDARSNRQMFD